MNILFLTLGKVENIDEHSLYCDLFRKFRDYGHQVYIVSPREKRAGLETEIVCDNNVNILHVKIGNITKCNTVEKGFSTVMIESNFKVAIRKYFNNVKFDLVVYSTPPITLAGVVEYVKKRDNAKSYLLLKDIFPQNSVDLGMLTKTGVKGLIYKYFRSKEKKLYALSDRIGCMSQANCDYVLKHNPKIPIDKVELCPNCIELVDMRVSEDKKIEIRKKYDLPLDKKIFVYGGNLGRPQDVPFIVECLKACVDIKDAYFVLAGSGADRHFLEEYMEKEKPKHVKLFDFLPKDEYDRMVAACDVGLIFLDHRFTIPNFPSRLLAYMQAGLPVLACTDPNTDVGKVIVNGGFGWWCESNAENIFKYTIQEIKITDDKGEKAWMYLKNNYSADIGYQIIMSSLLMKKD